MTGVVTALQRWPEALRSLLGGAAVLVAVLLLANAAGLATPSFIVILGLLFGLSYGMLAMCFVLVFRTSGILNFTQPAVGAIAACVVPLLTTTLHLPYWLAFALMIAAGFGLGALIETTAVRRMAKAPRVVVVAATVGIAAVLLSLRQSLRTAGLLRETTPPGVPQFAIGPLLVTPNNVALAAAAPIVVVALTLFMTRTRLGLAIRASASNGEAAALAGIPPRLMTATAWGLAGAVGAVVSLFSDPLDLPSVFTAPALLPALAAAAVARMHSYTRAVVAGVVLGVVQQVLQWGRIDQLTSAVMCGVVAIALLVLPARRGRLAPAGSWAAVAAQRPLPARLATLPLVRLMPAVGGALLLVAIALVGSGGTTTALLWSALLAACLLTCATGIVISLAGDLSFATYAVAGCAGAASLATLQLTGMLALAFVVAIVAGGLISVLLAYPGLRVGGLTLAVLSLAFAALTSGTILGHLWPAGADFGRPILGALVLSDGVGYFWWTLGLTLVGLWITRNTWRGGFGRIARAARDNIDAARSFGIATMRVRLTLFFVSGSLAALGGLLLMQRATVHPTDFSLDLGALTVLAAVLGGVRSWMGGVVGALWVFGLPALRGDGGSATVAFGSALALILACPGGLAQLTVPVRDAIAIALGRVQGVRVSWQECRGDAASRKTTPAPDAGASRSAATAATAAPGSLPRLRDVACPPSQPGQVLLEGRDIEVSFGSVCAVRGASVALGAGEIVGLIGTNGAGKTTTFEVLSGFVRPDSGSVWFRGRDITRLAPERRVALGLVRSFQDAALFPTLGVTDVVALSLERQLRTPTVLSLAGLDPTARARRRTAQELVDFFGLGTYATRTIAELSTGTRRMVELACMVALSPSVLLLDEPSSGIAQRETEALGSLLRRVHHEFEVSMAVIEHDLPLIMSLADRIVAMADGQVICTGTPEEVRRDPRLVEAYLGSSEVAINRSDHPAPPRQENCDA